MKYQLEFERKVVSRDGYSIEVEAESLAAATELAERMATEFDHSCPDGTFETGGVECKSWYVSDVTALTGDGSGPPLAANDTVADDMSRSLTLPADVWEGLMRAAQAGLPLLGMDDRPAIAAVAALKSHVHLDCVKFANAR